MPRDLMWMMHLHGTLANAPAQHPWPRPALSGSVCTASLRLPAPPRTVPGPLVCIDAREAPQYCRRAMLVDPRKRITTGLTALPPAHGVCVCACVCEAAGADERTHTLLDCP